MFLSLPKIEEEILEFWRKNKIFQKTLDKTKKGEKFVFFEGPPFANGLPGIHHLLSRAFKDIILRYKTMQGFYVERKAGWDTHGLPTEMAVEKKLKIKNKKEIEAFGIEKFIKECENNVFIYQKEWEDFSERIGFWLDFKNAYVTCEKNYIETLWWIFRQAWLDGFLYKDHKVVPYCPRCGTSLSSHEVAQGYKTTKEISIYPKFKVKGKEKTYFLAWTTTPWTLPANLALGINPSLTYAKVEYSGEVFYLAKDRVSAVFEKDFEIKEEISGEKLLGQEYFPLFESEFSNNEKCFKILAADFVSIEEGAGIVHLAPAFGIDDMEAAKKNDLPILSPVDEEGKFKKNSGFFEGLFIKDADILIIEDLEKRSLLFKKELHEHEYPFCWRCQSPLIYLAKNSWFLAVSKVKEEMILKNKSVNWVPENIKEGRFGEWLKEIKDWNISRERYWGTPLPIFECQGSEDKKPCGNVEVIGSISDLEKLGGEKIKNPHRPYIDEIHFKCERCGGKMQRVKEVADCWFDSGSMPFAQRHYPFENKKELDRGDFFPADFICEGVDQTRGWFYTLLAVSSFLKKPAPYKNVICLGLVLDAEGKKMSKSKGNIVDPKEVIKEFGADCARLYFYTINQTGDFKKYDSKEMKVLSRKFFDTLLQCLNFFEMYSSKEDKDYKDFKAKNVLDKWMMSLLENLNKNLIENSEKYDIVSGARLFLDFVDQLSNWYIRRSRQRFLSSESDEDRRQASFTLYYVLSKVSRLSAPFVPFFADFLHQKLGGKEESVHLAKYPKPVEDLIDNDLESKMKKVRDICVKALAARAKNGVKVRQPLKKISISDYSIEKENGLIELIKNEINVKEVAFDGDKDAELDFEITEDLRKEGDKRELLRNIKEMRKNLNMSREDKLTLLASDAPGELFSQKFLEEAGIIRFETMGFAKEEIFDAEKEVELGAGKFHLAVKK